MEREIKISGRVFVVYAKTTISHAELVPAEICMMDNLPGEGPSYDERGGQWYKVTGYESKYVLAEGTLYVRWLNYLLPQLLVEIEGPELDFSENYIEGKAILRGEHVAPIQYILKEHDEDDQARVIKSAAFLEILGSSPPAVAARKRKAGPGRKKVYDVKDLKRADIMRKQGVPVSEIAREMKRKPREIAKMLDAYRHRKKRIVARQ